MQNQFQIANFMNPAENQTVSSDKTYWAMWQFSQTYAKSAPVPTSALSLR